MLYVRTETWPNFVWNSKFSDNQKSWFIFDYFSNQDQLAKKYYTVVP